MWTAQETTDFRSKPKIFAENRRKLQIGLHHLRSVTFSSALSLLQMMHRFFHMVLVNLVLQFGSGPLSCFSCFISLACLGLFLAYQRAEKGGLVRRG